MKNPSPETESRRTLKSYVIRDGRMTPGQARALERLWPEFGVADTGALTPVGLFGNDRPIVLDVGFGMGDALAAAAAEALDRNFVGIEVHRPGIGHLLLSIEELALRNVRVIRGDARDALGRFEAGSVHSVQVFFPDPWPKKRHHKRRLIDRPFLDVVARALEPDGLLHIATDWDDYAACIADELSARSEFAPGSAPPRQVTKYQRRGERLGHRIHDLAYRRVATG